MLAVRIALRYLFSKKSHAAVNIISYVSIAGVAIATAAMVIVLSVFNGFSAFTASKLSRLDPDFVVVPTAGKSISDADSLCGALEGDEYVKMAAPVIEEKAFGIAGDRQMPITVRGVTVNGPTATAIGPLIIDGSSTLKSSLLPYTPAIASVGVANGLRTIPSYPITLKIYEPRRVGKISPSNPMGAFRADSVVVTGVYRVEQAEYDADMLIVPIDVARNLLDYSDEASKIEIRLKSGMSAAKARRSIEQLLPAGLKLLDRYEQEENSFKMIAIEKWVTLLMLTFILVIASFNILSTMSMLIVEKRGNRSIMLAMGATQGMVARTFAWLSFMISAIGGALGLIFGIGLSLAQQFGGFVKLNASDMSAMAIEVYPVKVVAGDLMVVLAVILVTGALTALLIRAVTSRSQ